MNRRGFIRALGLSPIAAKAAAEKELSDLTGVHTGLKGQQQLSVMPQDGDNFIPSNKDYKLVANIFRKQLSAHLYQSELKNVHKLDPDIANKKSFSLAAKITYQRQRNVENYINDLAIWGNSSAWHTKFPAFIGSLLGKG